jgi:23S rRNA (cytidine2498-2'-O)-methyltransferase
MVWRLRHVGIIMQNNEKGSKIYCGYLGKTDFLKELRHELQGHIVAEHGDLLIADVQIHPAFAIDIWPELQTVTFESINQAAKLLRQHGHVWFHYPISHVRRGTLIQEQMRNLPALKSIPFGPPAFPKMGVFSLLDQNTMIVCAKPWKTIPTGVYQFQEDKVNPPNRAYLKLWEALSIVNEYPKAGEACMDLGASPGGWTWVLQQLGADVIAVDKAPLAPNIAKLPRITELQQSAFALDFNTLPVIDWLVCDIACYPDKLLQQVQRWIESGRVKRILSTIKLQGETDFAAIQLFQKIPGARVFHLWYNKHELTFFWCQHQ